MRNKLLEHMISVMVILFCMTDYCHAQSLSAFDRISHDHRLSASNYCIYPDTLLLRQTPPPAGKRPFYISHYGRHGSRNMSNSKAYDIPLDIMAKADSLGKLTPLGKDVLRQLRIVHENVQGRYGDLTALGSIQHRHIARRMMEHYPEVFEGSAHIDAHSSTKIRCVLSMGAAIQQMVALNPKLQIRMDASKHDMWYLNYQDKLLRDSMMTYAATKAYQEFTQKREHNERLVGSLFNDTAYVRQYVDNGAMNYYLFKIATILPNTHLADSLNLINIFTREELYHIWQKENAWWYIAYGPSLLNGGDEPYTQRKLLRRIIEEADSCIALPKPGVSLRYGHDTVILPLTCLLNLNGYDFKTMDLEEVESNYWFASRVFPMAANIQFIFYRESPSDEDVIFKILLNEEEATLPLASSIAPYYRWSDFRDYYLKKLDAYEASR